MCVFIFQPRMTRMTRIFNLEHRVTETQSFFSFVILNGVKYLPHALRDSSLRSDYTLMK